MLQPFDFGAEIEDIQCDHVPPHSGDKPTLSDAKGTSMAFPMIFSQWLFGWLQRL